MDALRKRKSPPFQRCAVPLTGALRMTGLQDEFSPYALHKNLELMWPELQTTPDCPDPSALSSYWSPRVSGVSGETGISPGNYSDYQCGHACKAPLDFWSPLIFMTTQCVGQAEKRMRSCIRSPGIVFFATNLLSDLRVLRCLMGNINAPC